MQQPFQSPGPANGYRQHQPPPPADPGAEARFQADLARLQKAKGWRAFMYSKSDPAARQRFFATIMVMVGLGLGGLRGCAHLQQKENQRIMLRNLQTDQQNQEILLGRSRRFSVRP